MKKIIVFATLALSISLSTAVSISAQTIVNPSFEVGPGGFVNGYVESVTGAGITGWTVDSGNVDFIGIWWDASVGGKSVDLNGNTPGQISQTLSLIKGLTYQVSFDMSGNPDGLKWGGDPDFLKVVSVTAAGNDSQLYEYLVSKPEHEDMLWVAHTYTFKAKDDSTVLTFASNTPGPFGPVLDNVTITALTGQICHKNSGSQEQKTLIVGVSAVAAHLANHGDYPGPCTPGQ